MWQTLVNAFREKDIRRKIFMTFLILLIYRLGCYIPVPGLRFSVIQSFVSGNEFMSIMSTITGGSLSNGTLFALGIVPFINAFIIMQLLTLIIPPLERLSKDGEEGRKKITQYTRYFAIVLAIIQAIGIVVSWNQQGAFLPTFGSTVATIIFVVIILISGSCLVMWLGERITEFGIGNGTSLLIFVGILATACTSILSSFNYMNELSAVWMFIAFIAVVVAVFIFIIFVDLAVRNIPVTYAKQIKGNKQYGGQTQNIPIKVNASGVMPIIFASSFLMFPQMIASFWPTSKFYIWWSQYLGVGSWVYIVVMSVLILFFSFFYSQIQFNPDDIASNIKKNGGQIEGVRAGKPTSDYLKKINNRLTLFGAIFLAIIALVPSVVFKYVGQSIGLTNAFSATGMLIVVSVALEFNTQLESQIMMKRYKGFLK